jgi:hypothetical protein
MSMEARFLPYSSQQGRYCRNAMSDEKRKLELLDRSIEDMDPRDPGGNLPSRSEISGSALSRSPQTITTDPTSTIDDQPSCYRQFTQAASARSVSSSTMSTRRSGFTCQSDRPPSNLEEVLRSSSISGRGDQSSRQIGDTLSAASTVGTRPVPTGCPTKAHIIEVLWPWVKSIEPGTGQTHFVCKALLESYAERFQALREARGRALKSWQPSLMTAVGYWPSEGAVEEGPDAPVETWYVRYNSKARIYENAFKFVDRDGEVPPAYDLMNQDKNVINKLHSLMESLVHGRARASVDCETTWTLPFGPYHRCKVVRPLGRCERFMIHFFRS